MLAGVISRVGPGGGEKGKRGRVRGSRSLRGSENAAKGPQGRLITQQTN